MTKPVKDIPKKRRGRPKTTGRGAGVLVRFQSDAMKSLDRWSARQQDTPSRPEAIRRLVAMAIASAKPSAPVSRKAAARAADMAGAMVDFLSDPSAPADVREKRKRRLLKGPPEFREMRADLPKRKR